MEQQIYLFGQIQTSQIGGQPYSDTSPCEVSLYSVLHQRLGLDAQVVCD